MTNQTVKRFGIRHSLILGSLLIVLGGIAGSSPRYSDTAQAAGTADQSAFRVYPLSIVVDEPCSSDVSPTSARAGLTATASGTTTPYRASSPLQFQAPIDQAGGAYLTVDQAALSALPRRGTVVLEDFVLEADRTVTLDLEPVRVFDGQSEFVAATDAGDVPLPAPDVGLYRGTVRGEPGSHVFLGLGSGIINGYVSIGEERYSLSTGPAGALAASGQRCAIGKVDAIPDGDESADACEVLSDAAGWTAPSRLRTGSGSSTPGLRVCLLAVECDYDYYLQMGSDETAALDYVAQLIGVVSDIYERDLNTIIWLNFVRIWTTSKQPFNVPDECGLRGLNEFRQYGDIHLVDKEWTLAFKMSGCGGGGAGYLESLCTDSDRGRYPYATARVVGSFPFPLAPNRYNSDVKVVAHELGHNFGSPHTHCYDPPVDMCDSTESGCYRGHPVCTRGTIMSYCNRCGGLENIDLKFHPRVIEYMMTFVEASCMPVLSQGFYVCNEKPDVLVVDSIRSTDVWLSASRHSFLMAGHDSVLVTVRANWTQLEQAGAQGELYVYANGSGTPFVVAVTANRQRPFTRFQISADSGCWPLEVAFTDESTNGATAWLWDFGDGDTTTEPNPTHTYEYVGDYTVSLTTMNACGSHSVTFNKPIKVTEPRVCCAYQPFVVARNQPALDTIDLWSCAAGTALDPNVFQYTIVGSTEPDCGARVDDNRYLSIVPTQDWYGRSNVILQAMDPQGCICQSRFQIIVNDPPTIALHAPGPGVHIENEAITLSWTDEDADDNARIYFHIAGTEDCQIIDAINPAGLFEDPDDDADSFEWQIRNVPDGHYRIHARIVDLYNMAANDCSEGIVLIDQTPPVTVSSYWCTSTEEGGWCNGSVAVELEADDNLTGVEATYYRINGATWQTYTEPVSVSVGGSNSFEYYSVDVAGNAEPVRATGEPLRIDQFPPAVSSISSDNVEFHRGDFTSQLPSFGIQFTDDGIGIDPTTVSVRIFPGTLEGELIWTLDSTGLEYNEVARHAVVTVASPLQPGNHTLAVAMADGLGNESSASTEFVVGNNLDLHYIVNYPNPFPQKDIIGTSFTFTLTQPAAVSVRIFDLSGVLMKTLSERWLDAGYNTIGWDGVAQDGLTLANGTYIYEIVAKNASGSVRYLEKLAVLR
jgi:PKD repeat protein